MALSTISICSNYITTATKPPPVVISNKYLFFNFEQDPPLDQWNALSTSRNGASLSSTRAKNGTKSATSNGVASSTIYINTVSSSLSISPNTGLSFSLWFYITGLITNGDCKIWECGGNNKYFIRIPNNTSTFFFCDKGSAVSFSLNTWNHVVCTVNSSNAGTVYLNGAQATTYSTTGLWTQSLQQLFIGRSVLGSHNSILGNIDDFKIYSKVLTLTEVQAIYDGNDA